MRQWRDTGRPFSLGLSHSCISCVSFCSLFSFHGCLYKKQPQKIEIVSPSEVQGRFPTSTVKTMSASMAKDGQFAGCRLWKTKALGRESPQPCSKPTVCAALTCSAPHHPPETSGTRGAQAKGQLCRPLCCEWSGNWGTALVVQGLRVPADAGTQVWSLVQEGSACHRAPEPGHHNCWA